MILLERIRRDGQTEARVEMNADAVADYAMALRGGEKLPPVVLFFDGRDYWLADGFHRCQAALEAGLLEIAADVHPGGQREATLWALGANTEHGVRPTPEDKRFVVARMLHDAEWARWSDREIAGHCRVSIPFVAKMRKLMLELEPEPEPQPDVVVIDDRPTPQELWDKIYPPTLADEIVPPKPAKPEEPLLPFDAPQPALRFRLAEFNRHLDALHREVANLAREYGKLDFGGRPSGPEFQGLYRKLTEVGVETLVWRKTLKKESREQPD